MFSHISRAHISKSKRCFNVKSSTYYFLMKTKIFTDFQICISVPLKYSTSCSTWNNHFNPLMHNVPKVCLTILGHYALRVNMLVKFQFLVNNCSSEFYVTTHLPSQVSVNSLVYKSILCTGVSTPHSKTSPPLFRQVPPPLKSANCPSPPPLFSESP